MSPQGFQANVRPDPDLRYRSNAAAFVSSENAKYITNRHGANFDVCGDLPALSSSRSISDKVNCGSEADTATIVI
jgi:hypothetical protein